MNKNAKKLDLA